MFTFPTRKINIICQLFDKFYTCTSLYLIKCPVRYQKKSCFASRHLKWVVTQFNKVGHTLGTTNRCHMNSEHGWLFALVRAAHLMRADVSVASNFPKLWPDPVFKSVAGRPQRSSQRSTFRQFLGESTSELSFDRICYTLCFYGS